MTRSLSWAGENSAQGGGIAQSHCPRLCRTEWLLPKVWSWAVYWFVKIKGGREAGCVVMGECQLGLSPVTPNSDWGGPQGGGRQGACVTQNSLHNRPSRWVFLIPVLQTRKPRLKGKSCGRSIYNFMINREPFPLPFPSTVCPVRYWSEWLMRTYLKNYTVSY